MTGATAGHQASEEYDVVVVGSGAGGLGTALVCRHAGLSVLVLEKTAKFGGSTAVSGGAVWIPDNPHMAGVGHRDTLDAARRYLRQTVGDALREPLMEAYLQHGPEMVRFMEAHTEVNFIARAVSPDYKPELDGAMPGGRTIDPAPFDGRTLGPLFEQLRRPLPSFLALGGMMVNRKDIDALLAMHKSVAALAHALPLLLRYAKDCLKWSRGTRLVLGNALAARLLKSAHDAGITLMHSARVTRLETNGARVSGVTVEIDGKRQTIAARRAVVLATGGYAQNAALRAKLVPHADLHRSMAPEGNTGDGALLAEPLGGHFASGNAGAAFWTPVSVFRDSDGREAVFPHLITDRQKPGIMAVDANGRRFANEATSYHDFVAAMHRANATAPCVPAWLVCDSHFVRKYGLGRVRPRSLSLGRYVRSGYLKCGATLDALAHEIGVPPEALEQSAARMNAFAKSGVDEEFGRGNSAYDRYLGDASQQPNPCLGPIETGPFYAVRIVPGDIGSATGLETNERAQVLDGNGAAIAGLYAVGNDMNSVMGGTYPAAGITLGPALTFGYIAGRDIAAAAGTTGEPVAANRDARAVAPSPHDTPHNKEAFSS
jgi:succinate dehydrogenase/fumarate reductase flavoprotein subunit